MLAKDVTLNPDLPSLHMWEKLFDVPEYEIPDYDLMYEHVWYLDPDFYPGDRIWVWKFIPPNSEGVKDMGYVTPLIPKKLDVVFISYTEINAEDNWQRLLSKVPDAKRVHGATGIVEAHRIAAKIASTDMLYVVDGDSYINDDFGFDFVPSIFDRYAVHIFQSTNPINDLVYGYGGIKIFPREHLLTVDSKAIDVTTSVAKDIIVVPRISNTTAFNTDAFATWRSAFRECSKLASGTIEGLISEETNARIHAWCTIGADRPFGSYAIKGARAGYQFGSTNKDDQAILSLVNDHTWLRDRYDSSQ